MNNMKLEERERVHVGLRKLKGKGIGRNWSEKKQGCICYLGLIYSMVFRMVFCTAD
jgi:hypothetical protein